MHNLFDILGLPASYTLDERALEQAYFAAQRATHPDRLIGKPEAERIAAFEQSQLVNDAYETLKDPLARAEHLLALRGVIVNADDSRDVPPMLLMEMMELRERLEESAQSGVALAGVVGEIKQQAGDSQRALATAFASDDLDAAAQETTRLAYVMKALEQAHMLIYRLKAQAQS